MNLFLEVDFAARHQAGIDMCPSAGAPGTGHVICEVTGTAHTRASTVLQSAVLAFASLSSPKARGTGSAQFVVLPLASDGVVSVCQTTGLSEPNYEFQATCGRNEARGQNTEGQTRTEGNVNKDAWEDKESRIRRSVTASVRARYHGRQRKHD